MEAEGAKALSVSAAVAIAKEQLESITLKVVGEVSELSNKPGYSAVYFTLKDQDGKAVLPCMMWMNRFKAAGIEFQIGSVVEITGRFSLYAAKGRMNFDVFSVALAGEGDLRLQIANLAKKLAAEGLMAPERKKALPAYPQRIGLVTSPCGAVVYDVLRTLRRRYPMAEVLVAGVPVEGKEAPEYLMQGLQAVQAAGAQVVVLARGGGSFEDFMPFNDEALARYIASMNIPVVTGIGHEPDTTIADMVADMRASTPTAAAEAVAPASADILNQLATLARRMGFALSGALSQYQRKLLAIQAMPLFSHPMGLLREQAQALDDAALRLEAAIPALVLRRSVSLDSARMRLVRFAPRLIGNRAAALSRLCAVLEAQGHTLVKNKKEKVAVMAASLEGLSPLAVLTRGYAAVFDNNNHVIASTKDVLVGSTLNVRLADGKLVCNVENVVNDVVYTQEG